MKSKIILILKIKGQKSPHEELIEKTKEIMKEIEIEKAEALEKGNLLIF
jgi:hypothetical protein